MMESTQPCFTLDAAGVLLFIASCVVAVVWSHVAKKMRRKRCVSACVSKLVRRVSEVTMPMDFVWNSGHDFSSVKVSKRLRG